MQSLLFNLANAGCCGICKISVCLGLYLRELLVFLIEEASLMHVKQFAYSAQNCTAKIDVTVWENGETSEWLLVTLGIEIDHEGFVVESE